MKTPSLVLIVLLSSPCMLVGANAADITPTARPVFPSVNQDSALISARTLVIQAPDNPSNWYRMAYLFSLSGDVDSAIAWLDNAVTHGFVDYLHFELDADLDPIRSDPRYPVIVARARREALREAASRSLTVGEGEWTAVEMQSRDSLPQVAVSLSFDNSAFLIRATVHDAHFRDSERSWRYGDGFLMNFMVPGSDSTGYTDKFHAFGFSLEHGRPITVLVNRDGKFRLQQLAETPPKITIDTVRMTARYDVRIPWTQLAPFHPLLDTYGGFNIRYTSQGDAGQRSRVTYLDNTHFDSERTPLRRYAPLTFRYGEPSPPAIAGRLEPRLLSGDSGSVMLAVWSPEAARRTVHFSLRDSSAKEVWSGTSADPMPAGRTMVQRSFPLPSGAGAYRLHASLDDSLSLEGTLYRYDADALERARGLTAASHAPGEVAEYVLSLEALRYRINVLDGQIREFNSRSDLDEVCADLEDLLTRAEELGSQKTLYGRPGYMLSGFRSSIDSSLQPFSIVFPERYDRSKRHRLYVVLHGSGVDEVQFVRGAAQNIRDSEAIVLAPRGRDLSGWWQRDDERDAVELIGTMKRLLPVEKTLCLGFSMGGYGTWRMSMLHPELFDAAVVISGTPVPRGGEGADGDMRTHIGSGRELSYFVVHGTQDRALPIDATDGFVEMLKKGGYDVTYVRIEGGGHGNIDLGKQFARWTSEKILNRRQ